MNVSSDPFFRRQLLQGGWPGNPMCVMSNRFKRCARWYILPDTITSYYSLPNSNRTIRTCPTPKCLQPVVVAHLDLPHRRTTLAQPSKPSHSAATTKSPNPPFHPPAPAKYPKPRAAMQHPHRQPLPRSPKSKMSHPSRKRTTSKRKVPRRIPPLWPPREGKGEWRFEEQKAGRGRRMA